MKRILGVALAAAIAVLCQPARAIDLNVVVLASCGTVPTTLPAGTGYSIFTDQNGNLCMNGSVTVTPSGTQNVNLTQVGGVATNNTTAPVPVAFYSGGVPVDPTLPAQVVGAGAGGSAATGNPVGIGGIYNSTIPTYPTGQRTDIQTGTRGAINTTLFAVDSASPMAAVATNSDAVAASSSQTHFQTASLGYLWTGSVFARTPGSLAGAFVMPGGFSFSHITTATTTTAKSGAGSVHTICVNSLGTVASTVTVYDNTAGSGTVIAVINSLALLGCQTYDVAFATGLTLVTTGTVAPDVTVSYR